MNLMNLCAPALVALIITIFDFIRVTFILGERAPIFVNVLGIILVIIFIWVLNYLCSKGYKTLSWIIVLGPYALGLIGYALYKDACKFLPREVFCPKGDGRTWS